MQYQHTSRFLYFLLTGSLLFLMSCKKLVEVPLPLDQPTTAIIFSDDQTATTAINGLYSSMMNHNFGSLNSGITLYPALSADELSNTEADPTTGAFTSNSLNPGNDIVADNFWKITYNNIYTANSIIEGLSKSASLSSAVKNQLTGEATFSRALCYFYLVNLFGDVPYITGTDYRQNSIAARTGKAEIYDHIIADLVQAQSQMSSEYPSDGKVRPNKSVAAALLARVFLYLQRWPEAEQAAAGIIDAGSYSLVALNEVFKANSDEAIWQLLPVLSYLNTADGFTFIPYSPDIMPQYILTNWLMSSFEPGDQRKASWTASNTVNGESFFYPFKYQVRSGNTISEYNMLFRLAEQYLIRSEARAMQNNIAGAQDDLNMIRTRAGLPNTAAASQPALLTAIEHERQTEFFAECGHRWFDLRRTGRLNAVLAAEKTGWLSTSALYPIPKSEIESNPNLTQNPGY